MFVKKILLLIAALAVMISFSAYSHAKENPPTVSAEKIELAKQKVEEGDRLCKERKFDEAIKLFTEAIELNPNDADAYNDRGAVLYDVKNNYAAALGDYNKAIALNPELIWAYYNRAMLYNNQENYDAALIDFDKAIELKPDFAKAHFYRATIFHRAEKYSEALAGYDKAVEFAPNFAEAYFQRGMIHFAEKNYNLAIAEYTKAIEVAPRFRAAYFQRGRSYEKLGDLENANADFEREQQLRQAS